MAVKAVPVAVEPLYHAKVCPAVAPPTFAETDPLKGEQFVWATDAVVTTGLVFTV